MIEQPEIIRVYNKHMGGVDALDANAGRIKIKLKSKKWCLRIFFHITDVTVCNS